VTWQGAAWLGCKTVPGRVRGAVPCKQVALLEFKSLPMLILLVNPRVKGRRGEKKKRQSLIEPSIPGCLGQRWRGWLVLGLEQA